MCTEDYKEDIKTAAANPQIKEGFVGMTLGTVEIRKKEDAGKALLAVCQNMGSDELHIGSYRGFDMHLTFHPFAKEFTLRLQGNGSYSVALGDDIRGNITRLDNAIDSISRRLEAATEHLVNTENQMTAAKVELRTTFAQENELQQKSARLAELNLLLDMDSQSGQVISDPQESESQELPDDVTDKSEKPAPISKAVPSSYEEYLANEKKFIEDQKQAQKTKSGPVKSMTDIDFI